MEFAFIGMCLIVSAVLLKKTRELNETDGGDTHGEFNGEYFAFVILGLIMFLIGVVGLLWGAYAIKPDRRGFFTLFFVVSALNVQARLLNYSFTNKEEAGCLNRENSNGIDMLRKAYSVGVFPKNGSYIFLIHATQVCQVVLIALVIFF